MAALFRKPWFWIGIAALPVVFYLFSLISGEDLPETVAVKRGTIIQDVAVTGRVQPAESVALAFEKSGRVSFVNAKVSDRVFRGQLLVQLENNDLLAQLTQTEATLASEQAVLDELNQGTRIEEVEVQKAEVEDARSSLIEALRDSHTKADDAVRNKVDQFISNSGSQSPQIVITLGGSVSDSELEAQRANLGAVLSSWKLLIDNISNTSDFSGDVLKIKENLKLVKNFLDLMAIGVNGATPNASVSQATLDSYRSDVATARTNVNTALSNVASKESALAVEEQQLKLKESGSIPEKIRAQEAKVKYANGAVDNIRALILKTIIRSPINGVVTKQDAKAGEIAAANTPLVSVISESEFEIEADIPEADIAKLAIGNPAKVTLDAYRNEVIFDAKVERIDPAETVIEGVSTYKTILLFLNKDARIKSGMTANIDILTAQKDDVLILPQRVIFEKEDGRFVTVLRAGKPIDVLVETGIRGSDGSIEITKGLSEGEQIVLSR